MSMRTGKDKQRVFRQALTTALVVVGVLSLGQLRQAMAAPARGGLPLGSPAARVALSFNPFELNSPPGLANEASAVTRAAGGNGQRPPFLVPDPFDPDWIPGRPPPRSRIHPGQG